MTEAQTFHCPSCSAPLEAPDDGASMRCPYCGSTVLPPGATARAQPAPSINVYTQSGTVIASTATLDLREVKSLLDQGVKVEAVKRVREATGLGLKQSQDSSTPWKPVWTPPP